VAAAADDAGGKAVERASLLQSGRIVTRPSPERFWNVCWSADRETLGGVIG